MGKYFPDITRHAKAQEFLELKQGTMTVLEYMARFTELAHFTNDYMATDMAKVRRFENELKLSIRVRIVGHGLHREIKRKESQSSSSSGKKPRASSSRGFQSHSHPGQGQIRVASQARQMVCYHCK